MTALLVSLLLQASACPAEAQPEWATATPERRRELHQACLDERFDVREREEVKRPVEPPRPDALDPGPEALHDDDPWAAEVPVPATRLLPEADRPTLPTGARVLRLTGAVAGGFIGGGLMALGQLSNPLFCDTLCGLSIFAMPLGVMVGSAMGYWIAGGDPAVLAPAAFFAPSAALALFAWFFPGLSDTARTAGLLTAALTMLAGSAWSLLSREDQLVSLGRGARRASASGGRVALTVLADVGLSLVAAVGVGMVATLCFGTCVLPALAVATAVVTLGEWGIHRAAGGQASAVSMLAALLLHGAAMLGVALTSSFTFFGGGQPVRSYLPLTAFVLTSVFGPALVFEWSHTVEMESRARTSWWAGAAPTPGGGALAVGVRF